MNKEQIELLGEYIKNTNFPILIKEIPQSIIEKGAVIIKSDCSNEELIGGYKDNEFQKPEWYNKLFTISKNNTPILVIDKINEIPENEQRKFIEILKYKKTYVNKLPENCKIFVTYTDLKEKPIEEEVYSFLVQF